MAIAIKFNKRDNKVSMTKMPMENDLIERNAHNSFWLRSKRKLQGLILLITIGVIIVGFSVIKHEHSISSHHDNER